ncbi:hypothetical protein P4S72_05985 [Vibrio sp. PP-XX7]
MDYGILIEGELTLIVDKGEVVLQPGSIVVQRGLIMRGRIVLEKCAVFYLS